MPNDRAAASARFMRGTSAPTRIVEVLHQCQFHMSTTTTPTVRESSRSSETEIAPVLGSRRWRTSSIVRGSGRGASLAGVVAAQGVMVASRTAARVQESM